MWDEAVTKSKENRVKVVIMLDSCTHLLNLCLPEFLSTNYFTSLKRSKQEMLNV